MQKENRNTKSKYHSNNFKHNLAIVSATRLNLTKEPLGYVQQIQVSHSITNPRSDFYNRNSPPSGLNVEADHHPNVNRNPKQKCKTDAYDDFDFIELIGKGTYATVELVREKTTSRFYALKIFDKTNPHPEAQFIEDAINEVRLLSSINFPFIITVHKHFEDNSNIYTALEYIKTGDLYFHLGKIGKFKIHEALFFSAQLVLVLDHLHSQNIIHKDLKPENVLVEQSGYIKLTDFGLSERISASSRQAFRNCGSPLYMAPEIMRGNGYNYSVDWWSLGVFLFELCSGDLPFGGDTMKEIFESIRIGIRNVKFPRFFPCVLVELIKSLLDRDVDRRLYNARKIKTNKFYTSINFQQLFEKKIRAPFIPNFGS